jgi:gamma-glutamyltranspeptidase/glutathione hydrolase
MELAAFLQMLAEDRDSAISFYHDSVEHTLDGKESTLSLDDMTSYSVAEHEPVSISYRGHDISLASPPSAGGLLVAHALKFLEAHDIGKLNHNSAKHIRILVEAIRDADSERTSAFFSSLLYQKGFWKKFLDRLGGTTHVSIIDSEGNAAAITTSNGQGSGIMAGNTGIMLNNFAAEPDLMQYKDLYTPGGRITSMMTPTIIGSGGKLEAVLGTGGSNRIKSAIMQTVSNLIDFKMTPQQATDAPRAHYEFDVLQLEQGISKSVIRELQKEFRTNAWSEKNLYFGGVHIAAPGIAGGDKRRGGAVLIG